MSEPVARLVIGSLLRHSLGLLALGGVLTAAWFARTIDWGVAWMVWVPCLALLVPTLALLQRRVLLREGDRVTVETGWIWRRALTFRLSPETALAAVPVAGCYAVLVLGGPRPWTAAAWLTATQRDRLLAWLDAAAPQGGWPRAQMRGPQWDR